MVVKEASSSAASSSLEVLDKFLEAHTTVQVINVQWLDISGVLRSRMVPVPGFVKMMSEKGYMSGSFADLNMPVTQRIIPEIIECFTATGKVVPDLSSLRVARHDSAKVGNAAVVFADVLCSMGELCPRSLLKRVVEKAEEDHGLRFLVGFELEFCFLEKDKVTAAEERQLGMFNASLLHRSKYWPVLNQIALALGEAGIHVEQVHKEYAMTQFEIALPPMGPLEAVDARVYACEVIKDVAWQYDLVATFYPDAMPSADGLKNGQHIHISAQQVKKDVEFDPQMFLGGLLSHIPAICAIGMPNLHSYSRVEAGHFGAGKYVGWGTNNRDSPVRLVTQDHWEVRCNDATSNPYLMVAAIISAGLDKKPLTIKDSQKFTPSLSEEERAEMGMTQELPDSIGAALDALRKDEQWAKAAMGEYLYKMYLVLKESDWKTMAEEDEKEQTNVVKLLDFF